MPLKPQDLLVCLHLATCEKPLWTYAQLASALGLSVSEAKAAVDRSLAAGLLAPAMDRSHKPSPLRRELLDFLVHGAKHAFFVEPGRIVRGVPTAWAAPPLGSEFAPDSEPPPVWPSAEGSQRGQAIEPLYHSAPGAALANPALYELLALTDAIRLGRARERALAAKLLRERLIDQADSNDPSAGDAA